MGAGVGAAAKKAPTTEQNAWVKTNIGWDPGGLPAADGSNGSALPDKMEPVAMQNEGVARQIASTQLSILTGWKAALDMFKERMTAASDKEATPDFQKSVFGFVEDLLIDKIMGEVKDVPGAAELQKFAKAIKSEADRATKAMASVTLRNFMVEHTKAFAKLEQGVRDNQDGFVEAVKAVSEGTEGAARSGKPGKPGLAKPSKAIDDYGMMRMALMDVLAKLLAMRQGATPELLFRKLSEEWHRAQEVRAGMGVKLPAFVIVQLEKDYSVKQAYFQGAGGQKIAEGLLYDSPEGVDVLSLKTNKQIFYPGDGNPGTGAIASLDANNRDISNANMGEGHTEALIKVILAKGKLIAKKVKGDS
jgi:hypothetical protein